MGSKETDMNKEKGLNYSKSWKDENRFLNPQMKKKKKKKITMPTHPGKFV